MSRDFEDELRRSLHARAGDITPDPALFARVQSRIARGRAFRIALAGVAGALAIAGAAIAAPGMMDRRVEFEPGPIADQPASEASPAPTETATPAAPAPAGAIGSAPMLFTDGRGVYRMAIDGESAEEIIADGCPDEGTCDYDPRVEVDAVAAPAPLGFSMATTANCGGLTVVAGPESTVSEADALTGDTCPASLEFSPDGSHLAWVAQVAPEGEWWLFTVDWTGDGPGDDDASFKLDVGKNSRVRIDEWTWSPPDRDSLTGDLFLRITGADGTRLMRQPIERQGDGTIALPSPTMEEVRSSGPASAPDQPESVIAVASGSDEATHEYSLEMSTSGGNLVRQDYTTGDTWYLELPEAFVQGLRPRDLAEVWLSAAGDDAVLGDGRGRAWTAHWDADGPEGLVPLEADMIHAVVLPQTDDDEVEAEPTSPAAVEAQVDVFFGMTGADACVADHPVQRQVEGAGVARAAVTYLLEGPTSRESNEGVVSPFSAYTAGTLNDITIVDGQARVDFMDFSAQVPTDSCTKSAIVDALDRTLLQFPTVTSTQYSFDGSTSAWKSWLGSDTEHPAPPAAIVDTAAAVRAAAQDRDWDSLRRLSAETSCTSSDQPEPCVPHWKDQEANGEDPLGTLVDLLEQPATKHPDALLWVWPRRWAISDDYTGPRVGIDEDGVWRYYVQAGEG